MKNKNNFYLTIAEKNLINMFTTMGESENKLISFQKKRVFKVFFVLGAGMLFSFLLYSWIFAVSLALVIFLWLGDYNRIKSYYRRFTFEKQLVFSKFMRTLIPYLLQSNSTVYGAFLSMIGRLDEGHVKRCLQRLLIEMNDSPNDVTPFKNFANLASGTDSAMLFMTTLYDFQQNSTDSSVVIELGQMAKEQLFAGVNEIVEYKLKKFLMFPTKLVMSSFVLIIGYASSVMLDVVSSISF